MAQSKMAKKEPEAHKEHSHPDHHHKAIKHHIAMLHKMAKDGHKKHESKKAARHHEHAGMEKRERGPVKSHRHHSKKK